MKHLNTKYFCIKNFFIILFLIHGFNIFSQINHEDSTDYFEYLKLNISLGNDIRGKTVSGFNANGKNGASFTDNDLRSKTTFINFWFEACAPCVAEFQALEKFYNNNKSREKFQFVSITFEADSTIERIRKKNNLSYPIYHLSIDSCRKIIGRLGYPATFIVNKNLEIVYATGGGPTDPKIADKYLNYFVQAELVKQLK